MYINEQVLWNKVEVLTDENGIILGAQENQLSKAKFSTSDWKVVSVLGNKLKTLRWEKDADKE